MTKLCHFGRNETYMKGTKLIQEAAFSSTYKTVWCAGPSIEHVNSIQPLAKIVSKIRSEFEDEIS